MTLLAPFDVQRDKEIQDFNYEVDALEDEHVRREVHTTKIVAEEEQNDESANKHDYNDNSFTNNSQKNKRTRKIRGKPKPKETQLPRLQNTPDEKPKPTSLKMKREQKKSIDMFKEEVRSDDNSEPHPIIPNFSGNNNKGQPQIVKEKSKFSFAASNANLQPAIPPPFRKPIPSMESVNGFGDFGNMDDPMYFKMLNRSIEKMPQTVSREFMDHNNDHEDRVNNVFRNFSTPFASGEFGRIFEQPNDQHRNLIHPTPKYQK